MQYFLFLFCSQIIQNLGAFFKRPQNFQAPHDFPKVPLWLSSATITNTGLHPVLPEHFSEKLRRHSQITELRTFLAKLRRLPLFQPKITGKLRKSRAQNYGVRNKLRVLATLHSNNNQHCYHLAQLNKKSPKTCKNINNLAFFEKITLFFSMNFHMNLNALIWMDEVLFSTKSKSYIKLLQ